MSSAGRTLGLALAGTLAALLVALYLFWPYLVGSVVIVGAWKVITR